MAGGHKLAWEQAAKLVNKGLLWWKGKMIEWVLDQDARSNPEYSRHIFTQAGRPACVKNYVCSRNWKVPEQLE